MKRLPLLGLMLLVALLVPAFRDAMLLGAAWVLHLLITGVPPWVYWGLLILFGLWMGRRSLDSGLHAPSPHQHAEVTEGQQRVAEWETALNLASQSPYFAWQLSRQLGKLSLEVLAQRKGLPPQQLEQELDSLELPPDIQSYLRWGMTSFDDGTDSPHEREQSSVEKLVCHLEAQVKGSR